LHILDLSIWNKSSSNIAKLNALKINSKAITSALPWIDLANILHPVRHASFIVLNKNLVLSIGGIEPEGKQKVAYVQLFDSRSNDWRLLSPLPREVKNPQLWTNLEQSVLYLQPCLSSTHCTTDQAHIIWSCEPETEKCLSFSDMNCTTRKLQRAPHSKYSDRTEVKWTKLFSQIYLINLPVAVERLRRSWYELNRIDMTSVTLIEGFQVPDLKTAPMLIREDWVWTTMVKKWKAKNDTTSLPHYIRSSLAIKLIYMHLWTKNIDRETHRKPMLIMEDDIMFIRSRNETFEIIEKSVRFLKKQTKIQWDLLYLDYRNIEATLAYQISQDPPIALWRASIVLSNTAFIVNTDPRTVEKLNKCFVSRLNVADIAISFCVKHQLINAYLINPKVVKSIPGFSFNLNSTFDYVRSNPRPHLLDNNTRPATFKIFTQDQLFHV
jgi:hypothetical protein